MAINDNVLIANYLCNELDDIVSPKKIDAL